MKNLLNFVDIAAVDFERAVAFYEKVLDIRLHCQQFGEDKMAFFPSDGKNVSGAICQGMRWQPSMQGSLVYFNGGEDLQAILDRVEAHGGKVLLPKTHLGAEYGYIALFVDSEGNRMGLHSPG